MTYKFKVANNILQALELYGPQTSDEIVKKLKMRDIDIRIWEVEQVLISLSRRRDVVESKAKGVYLIPYK